MEALREHILKATEPIKARIEEFISAQPDNKRLKWQFCVRWPVDIATDLACRVALLSPRGLSNDTVDRLIASLATRYMFDLLANVCVMLNTKPEEERDKLQDQWIKLRDMVVAPDGTYRMLIEHLPSRTSERLQKKGFKSAKWPKYDQTLGKEKLVESVAVGDKSFLFEDPWGLSMAKKVDLIPMSNRELFLDRWKMYSYVAHASAFSLWPTWMDPIPIFDATQSLSLLLKVVGNSIGYEFDSKLFMDQAWLHIEEDQERARVQA